MNSRKSFSRILGIISLILASYANGNAQEGSERTDRWILYGISEDGDHYYDK